MGGGGVGAGGGGRGGGGLTSRKEEGTERPLSIPRPGGQDRAKGGAGTAERRSYEQDFLGWSYGFRPGRSPQEALDEIGRVICRRPVRLCVGSGHLCVLRCDREEPAHGVIEKRVRDGEHSPADREMDQRGCVGGRTVAGHADGGGPGAGDSARCWHITCTTCSTSGLRNVVKPRLRGEAYEIGTRTDFIVCFQ